MDVTFKIHNKIEGLINGFRSQYKKDPVLILVSSDWFLEIFNAQSLDLYYTSIQDLKEDLSEPRNYRGIRFECIETLGQEYKFIHLKREDVLLFETMPEKIQSRSITGNYIPVYHYKKTNR